MIAKGYQRQSCKNPDGHKGAVELVGVSLLPSRGFAHFSSPHPTALLREDARWVFVGKVLQPGYHNGTGFMRDNPHIERWCLSMSVF